MKRDGQPISHMLPDRNVASIADASGESARRPRAEELDPALLLRLTANAPHALAVTQGPFHLLRSVNPALCRLLDVTAEDVVGRPFAESFPGAEAAQALLERVARSGMAEEEQELVGALGGSEGAVLSFTVWPLTGGTGDAKSLVIEVRDRTAAAASQRRLEEMSEQIREINERLLSAALREQSSAEKAEAADRAKSDFLAMMSHELRTPLTGIVGYTDVLETGIAGPVTDRQRSSLARIRECSAQLLDLIDDVLSFAKVEAQRAEVVAERVDLCALAREAAAVVEPLIKRKGLRLHIDTPDDSVTVETDPRKVRQILLNLLSNAVKFTERGEIRIELRADQSAVDLLVQDTGIGIEPVNMERVFQPFVQAEAVLTRSNGGTGLGLAISRALATMIGGDLRVKSVLGQGSTFTLHLPRAAMPLSDIA